MANKMEKMLGITAGALLLVGLPTGLAAKEDVRVKGISQVQAPVEAAQEEKQPEFLSLDEAKQIAFDHASVPGKDARFDDEELDKHDQLYELEFHVDEVEYEYDIHAVTKKVLKFERDNGAAKASSKTQSKTTKPAVSEKKETKTADNNDEPKQKKQTEAPKKKTDSSNDRDDKKTSAPKKQVNASETNTAPAKGETKKKISTKTVTKEQAVQIALKHAGVSASDVTFDDVELDDDDGRKHYEIEFHSSTHEYEYDIDAAIGKILDHEIEQDD